MLSVTVTCCTNIHILRRISCHGGNHSQASCEYSLTIFLCCQHHSEYSMLGSKFSNNLLFAASKCHVTIQRRSSSRCSKWPTGWDGCSGETLLAPCTRKKRLQRKMTKYCHWIGVQENIGIYLCERPARPMFIKLSYSCDDRKLFCELASTC